MTIDLKTLAFIGILAALAVFLWRDWTLNGPESIVGKVRLYLLGSRASHSADTPIFERGKRYVRAGDNLVDYLGTRDVELRRKQRRKAVKMVALSNRKVTDAIEKWGITDDDLIAISEDVNHDEDEIGGDDDEPIR